MIWKPTSIPFHLYYSLLSSELHHNNIHTCGRCIYLLYLMSWGNSCIDHSSQYVTWNLPWSLLAQGVSADLLQGSTPWTSYFHWSANVLRSELLSLSLCLSWVVPASGSLHGLPQCCVLSLTFCLALLVVLTVGSSHGKNCLISWRSSIESRYLPLVCGY